MLVRHDLSELSQEVDARLCAVHEHGSRPAGDPNIHVYPMGLTRPFHGRNILLRYTTLWCEDSTDPVVDLGGRWIVEGSTCRIRVPSISVMCMDELVVDSPALIEVCGAGTLRIIDTTVNATLLLSLRDEVTVEILNVSGTGRVKTRGDGSYSIGGVNGFTTDLAQTVVDLT